MIMIVLFIFFWQGFAGKLSSWISHFSMCLITALLEPVNSSYFKIGHHIESEFRRSRPPKRMKERCQNISIVDPDRYVFGPPGAIIILYGSGSFPLISTILWLPFWLFIYENWCKCTFRKYCNTGHLFSHWQKKQDPDPNQDLIPTRMSQIHNIVKYILE